MIRGSSLFQHLPVEFETDFLDVAGLLFTNEIAHCHELVQSCHSRVTS